MQEKESAKELDEAGGGVGFGCFLLWELVRYVRGTCLSAGAHDEGREGEGGAANDVVCVFWGMSVECAGEAGVTARKEAGFRRFVRDVCLFWFVVSRGGEEG